MNRSRQELQESLAEREAKLHFELLQTQTKKPLTDSDEGTLDSSAFSVEGIFTSRSAVHYSWTLSSALCFFFYHIV